MRHQNRKENARTVVRPISYVIPTRTPVASYSVMISKRKDDNRIASDRDGDGYLTYQVWGQERHRHRQT